MNKDLPINASIRTQLMDSQLFLNHVSNTKRLSRILNSVYEEKMEQLQALQIRVDDAINSF